MPITIKKPPSVGLAPTIGLKAIKFLRRWVAGSHANGTFDIVTCSHVMAERETFFKFTKKKVNIKSIYLDVELKFSVNYCK